MHGAGPCLALLRKSQTRKLTFHVICVSTVYVLYKRMIMTMNANMYFNALLRPAPICMQTLIQDHAPPHRQVQAVKVLKAQETMHRAVVWRELHLDWM